MEMRERGFEDPLKEVLTTSPWEEIFGMIQRTFASYVWTSSLIALKDQVSLARAAWSKELPCPAGGLKSKSDCAK